MTFRRLVLTGKNCDKTKQEIENYINGVAFKINYPDIVIKILKSPVKEDTLVIDIIGEGADTVSKKLKDQGLKYSMKATIKNQKPLIKM